MTTFILALVIVLLVKVIFGKNKVIEKQRKLIEELKTDATTRFKQSR